MFCLLSFHLASFSFAHQFFFFFFGTFGNSTKSRRTPTNGKNSQLLELKSDQLKEEIINSQSQSPLQHSPQNIHRNRNTFNSSRSHLISSSTKTQHQTINSLKNELNRSTSSSHRQSTSEKQSIKAKKKKKEEMKWFELGRKAPAKLKSVPDLEREGQEYRKHARRSRGGDREVSGRRGV